MGFVIAVDGPAASGKGTLAVGLARRFGLPHLDTGLLYRAVGVGVLNAGGNLDDGAAAARLAGRLDPDHLEDPALRTGEAGEAASRVAAHAEVRAALIALQRDFAAREPGAVLDGRDIGTVIAAGAQVKLYVTASPEVRAERRWRQLRDQRQDVTLNEILADIRRRDSRDESREAAPMRAAPDAVLLDTSDLTISQAFDAALSIVSAARGEPTA